MKNKDLTIKHLNQFDEDAILDFSAADEVRGGSYSMVFDESAEQAIFDSGSNDKKQLTNWLKTVRLLLEED
ncbi:MAG: hypothetical protein MUF58_02400 [Arcicella sp.]|jgi:hypothetical protein|nr:hypothetical protein [Arcicella sp.]